MNNYRIKHLIREAIYEKEELDLINAAISYLSGENELSVDPGVVLFSKAILCDKRNGHSKEYSKFNNDAVELGKLAVEKCDQIKKLDPELFYSMVKDGSNKKYRKLVDMGNKIVIVGE